MNAPYPMGSFGKALDRPDSPAMLAAFAAIDAAEVRHSRLAALSLQAVAIADAEVGPRSNAPGKSPLIDPQGFIERVQHSAAWNAVYRREARRLMGAKRMGAK